MNAEIGIDGEGRAYVLLSKLTPTEQDLMKYLRAFLPLKYYEFDAEARIFGDRLPGSGRSDVKSAYPDAIDSPIVTRGPIA